jgi:hypothetical protein
LNARSRQNREAALRLCDFTFQVAELFCFFGALPTDGILVLLGQVVLHSKSQTRPWTSVERDATTKQKAFIKMRLSRAWPTPLLLHVHDGNPIISKAGHDLSISRGLKTVKS